MEPSSLAVVLNPRAAGGRDGARRAERLRRAAAGRAVVFVTEDRDLMDAVARGVRERSAGAVAVVGGDGTLCGVLSALHRAYGQTALPPIAPLRGGTMNTVADALGVRKGRPEELLVRLLDRLATPAHARRVQRATLAVEGRLGFLFSAGVMAGFLERLYAQGTGRRAALSLLLRGAGRAVAGRRVGFESPLDASLTLDGVRHPPRRYAALGAGTVEQVGLGFRAYPRAVESLECFQVFAFAGNLRQLAGFLPRLHRGGRVPQQIGWSPLARELIIDCHDQPITYALDGELVRTGPRVAVTVGPSVTLLKP